MLNSSSTTNDPKQVHPTVSSTSSLESSVSSLPGANWSSISCAPQINENFPFLSHSSTSHQNSSTSSVSAVASSSAMNVRTFIPSSTLSLSSVIPSQPIVSPIPWALSMVPLPNPLRLNDDQSLVPSGTIPALTYTPAVGQTSAQSQLSHFESSVVSMSVPNPLRMNNLILDPGQTSVLNTTVPEFMFQLLKLLTDDNRELIEWSNGKILVHNPPKLATDVLHKYFRHSKYSSFQRQLNYFGFRKISGKGRLAPCSYINEAVTADVRSLLALKRKTCTVTHPTKKEISSDLTESNDSCIVGRDVQDKTLQNAKKSQKRVRSADIEQSTSYDTMPLILSFLAAASDASISEPVKEPLITMESSEGMKKPKDIESLSFRHDSKMVLRHQQSSGTCQTSANTSSSSSSSSNQEEYLGPDSNSEIFQDDTKLASVSTPNVEYSNTVTSMRDLNLPSSRSDKSNQFPVVMDTLPTEFTFLEPSQLGMGFDETQCESFHLCEHGDQSSMKRESSLVQLAMIPQVPSMTFPTMDDDIGGDDNLEGISFVDFL